MTHNSLQNNIAGLDERGLREVLAGVARLAPEAVAQAIDDLRGEKGVALNAAAKPQVANLDSASKTGESEEVSPEQQAWLSSLKTRFDAMPQLHSGVVWAEVDASLRADPSAMRKLQTLDRAGFEMNVFRSKNDGEIQFRTAQMDVTKIDAKYRTIMADIKAQTGHPEYEVDGNAEKLAIDIGVEVADPELYEQLRVQSGRLWLKTDVATRRTGDAFCGRRDGVIGSYAYLTNDRSSFCAALRVKKVA